MSLLARFRDKDTMSGAIFLGTGLIFLLQSGGLSFGSTRSMGPGFLPLLLSALLCVFGGVVMARGILRGTGEANSFSVRALASVVAALLIFAFCVRDAGVAPTVTVVVLTACLGSAKSRVVPSVILALALAAFSCVIFVWALGLPLSVFGPWFPFY